MPVLDGAASVLIGLLLAAVATLLSWESRGLLIGEGIRAETAQAIRALALAQPGVRDVGRALSRYIGPDDMLVTVELHLDMDKDAAEAAAALGKVEQPVRERFPMIRRLSIEAGSAPGQQRWSRPDARPPAGRSTNRNRVGTAAAGAVSGSGFDTTRCSSAQTPTRKARTIRNSITHICSGDFAPLSRAYLAPRCPTDRGC